MSRDGWTRWHSLAAVVLLAIASFVQFTTVLQTRATNVVHGDGTKYVFYAYNLKFHQTFSRERSFGEGASAPPVADKLTLPGYPAFLSLFIGETPDTRFLARVAMAQAALGVVAVLLTFAIGLRLLPLGWAFGAAALAAITPHASVMNAHLMTEPLFTPLMLATVLAAIVAARPNAGWGAYALAGILAGAASLVRPQLQLAPFLLVLAALCLKGLRPRLPGILFGCACFVAVLGPWVWRNAAIERPRGEPDLLAASIYHGSFPDFMYRGDPRTLGYAYRFDPAGAMAAADVSHALRRVEHQFRESPLESLRWYAIGKPLSFLSWGFIEGASDVLIYSVESSPWDERPLFVPMREAARAIHWPMMALACFAVFLALRRPRFIATPERASTVLLAALFLYLIVLHTLGAPYPRYNVPFRPIAFLLAMIAVRHLWEIRRHSTDKMLSEFPANRPLAQGGECPRVPHE